VHQIFNRFFPAGARDKRRAFGLCLLALLPVMAGAQAPGRLVIPRASRVDISHVGIHTHANFISFDTGAHDLAAMQADPADYPRLTFKAHSRLPTDRAALPPGLAMPGDPPLDNPYGAMDGGATRPGWGVVVLHQGGRDQGGRNTAKVAVPTRFANWVALQPAARRKAYGDPRGYWLEVRWGGSDPLPVAARRPSPRRGGWVNRGQGAASWGPAGTGRLARKRSPNSLPEKPPRSHPTA